MKQLFIFIISALLLHTQNMYGAILYVTPSGSGSMDGSSWTHAYPGDSLQTAIDATGIGDEVWVACGTYKPTAGIDRTIAFAMKNNVTIYGSFNGTETLLNERTLSCGPCSILSGEIGITGNTDNSYKVIRNQGLNFTAIMDGFVIRDGHDDRAPTLTDGLGGGIINIGSGPGGQCSPTFRNCVITNNRAEFGGGIFNDGYNGGTASPIIFNCIIAENQATSGGGGIDNFGLSGDANPLIINSVITGNTAADAAGAIYCWGGNGGSASPVIYNTVIAHNMVTSGNGGGIIADRSNGGGGSGGGSGNVTITVINSIIRENMANTGPQFYTYENAILVGSFSNIDTIGQFAPHISQGPNTGNINANPLFLNNLLPIGADGCWMSMDDGYQLQVLSPCINAGDSTGIPPGPDLAFNDRITGLNIDMGAYEYHTGSMETESLLLTLLQVFPNPVMNELHIITTHQTGKIVLVNAIGQVIKQIEINGNNHYSINTEMLMPGIYFIRNETTGTLKKIIKQ